MGILDWFRRTLPATAPNGVPIEYRQFPAAGDSVLGMSIEELWRSQPYLRTVVTFLARNIAQLGLQSFSRVSDTDRERVHDDPLPLLLKAPNRRMTSYELVFRLVADLALYDEALWWMLPDKDAQSGWSVTPLSPGWVVQRGGGSVFEVAWYDVLPPGRGANDRAQRIPADQVLAFRGWNPDDELYGSSPVEALKHILAEQIHAQAFRQQIWDRGGRVGAVLTRPPGVEWSPEARDRFSKDWQAKWAGDNGPKAGGTPILEDGMTLSRVGFSAHEDEFVAAAKLSLSIVASAYHVNPTMVGVLENANYSNVREFRRMLYGDTLGPTMAMIEDRINTFLVPKVSSRDDLYVEFNIDEKLQGSFEEQTTALQSATGRPWMSANEARAIRNMPAVDGGDDLVIPLNVLVGGQASPTDSGTQNLASVRRPVRALGSTKGRAPDTHDAKHAQILAAFFKRQGAAVKSRLGAKADDDWWDGERWDAELAADLYALAVQTSKDVSAEVLDGLNLPADTYDVDRTLAFLTAVTNRQAGAINGVTKSQLDAALASDDPSGSVAHVFEVAQDSRAAQIAVTAVTVVSGFATAEAAKQAAGDKATKTWVTGSNPRSSHAAMSGETVGIDDVFSNGAPWPGSTGDVDEDAGCNCSIVVNVS